MRIRGAIVRPDTALMWKHIFTVCSTNEAQGANFVNWKLSVALRVRRESVALSDNNTIKFMMNFSGLLAIVWRRDDFEWSGKNLFGHETLIFSKAISRI